MQRTLPLVCRTAGASLVVTSPSEPSGVFGNVGPASHEPVVIVGSLPSGGGVSTQYFP